MRIPRVRFSVRGLMIAVAIAGCILAAELALIHQTPFIDRRGMRIYDPPWNWVVGTLACMNIPVIAVGYLAYRWWRSARRAFVAWRAARYPRLPVAPDSAEPE